MILAQVLLCVLRQSVAIRSETRGNLPAQLVSFNLKAPTELLMYVQLRPQVPIEEGQKARQASRRNMAMIGKRPHIQHDRADWAKFLIVFRQGVL